MYTKNQLIDQWLAKYPADANSPDLEHNALAGYVERNDGTFRLYRDWAAMSPIDGEKYLEDVCPF